jgi:hypothetical protein
MPKAKPSYKTILKNRKFEIHVLDPKDGRRDNIRVTLHSDDGHQVFHHLRAYEAMRFAAALKDAVSYGPAIPE